MAEIARLGVAIDSAPARRGAAELESAVTRLRRAMTRDLGGIRTEADELRGSLLGAFDPARSLRGPLGEIRAVTRAYGELGRSGEAAFDGLGLAADDGARAISRALGRVLATTRSSRNVLFDLARDFARIGLKRFVLDPFEQALPSGLGGLARGFRGFAEGGSFVVAGAGGTDSRLVAFRATPGERIDVAPPGARGEKAGSTVNMTVTVNVSGGINNHGRRTPGQVAAEIGRELARQARRNN